MSLAGTLNVTESPGVAPGTFTIITSSTSTFSTINLPACYTSQYNAGNVILTKSAPPVMTCPANSSVCITTAPYALTGATPPGGVYSVRIRARLRLLLILYHQYLRAPMVLYVLMQRISFLVAHHQGVPGVELVLVVEALIHPQALRL